jgi:glycosyltransferase involved in cell wall biosynthesis
MRILIIVDCYLPSWKSCARHIHDLARELLRQDQKVTVLTPSDAISRNLEVTLEEGLRIARVRTGKIKGTTKPFRAIQELRLSATLWRQARPFLLANPADLIIFYSPTIFFGALVRRLKSLWRCPAYLILRDIFPQWAVDAGVLKKNLAYRYLRRKELEQYAAADVIAVQSPANLNYFSQNLPDRHYRLEVLYNWASEEYRTTGSQGWRPKLHLENRILFIYGGNMGAAQDMANLVRLSRGLRDHSRIHFLFVGEGSGTSLVRAAIQSWNPSNMQLLSALNQDDYLALVTECDVGLISLDRKLTTHNVPGKLLGYLEARLPVLASINEGNDLGTILETSRTGFSCINGDDEGLRRYALMLADNKDLREQMGRRGRDLLHHKFSATAAATQILSSVYDNGRNSPSAQEETAACD